MLIRSLCTAASVGLVFGTPWTSHDGTSVGGLALLQQQAKLMSASTDLQSDGGYGSIVPLTEKGYQTIAALKDDAEMKAFVHRVVENEARYIKDVAELTGLVPFYSGTQSVQSLQALKAELRGATWVMDGEGRNAPLNEDGYQSVVQRRSRPHMMAFARRILDAAKKRCSDEGALSGFVPHFNGEVGVQSFEQLRSELLSVSWAVPRDMEQGATNSNEAHAVLTESKQQREEMTYHQFDENEAQERGALCLNGGTPGYYYKPAGSFGNSWVIAFAGGGYCEDADDCVSHASDQTFPTDGSSAEASADLNIFYADEFKEYNQVVIRNCDGGLSSGDSVLQHNGMTLYFRGKRILEWIIDALKEEHGFDSAESVLVVGGSGGGQITFLISDYLGTLMPKSVTKYAAVPMNAWYPLVGANGGDGAGASLKSMYELHNVTALSPSCTTAMGSNDAWKCLCADISYTHSSTPMFVVQMLDYQSFAAWDINEDDNWPGNTCLDSTSCQGSGCSTEDVSLMKDMLDSVVDVLQTGKNTYDGAFISTCTQHTFYLSTDKGYFQFANTLGETIDSAILQWWHGVGTKEGRIALPCEMSSDDCPHQCESTCNA